MGTEIELPLHSEEIQKLIPHRYPFLLIDKVIEFHDLDSVVCIKNVTANEPYFMGHFPGRPIMPGVLMLEALAQLAVLYAKLSSGGVEKDKLMVFTGADDVKFRRQVVPGDQLKLVVGNHRRKLVHWKIEGEVFIGDEKIAQATIKASEV